MLTFVELACTCCLNPLAYRQPVSCLRGRDTHPRIFFPTRYALEFRTMSFDGCNSLLSELLGHAPSPPPEKTRIKETEPASGKLWRYGKPAFPRIHVQRREMDGGEKLAELHCGCSCDECISNYKSYWTEKVYSKEIKDALDEELKVRKEILVEMARVDMANDKKLQELELSLVLADGKRKSLSEALESERQLRAEEVYRREVQKSELEASVAEGVRLEAKSLQQERDLTIARQEVAVLREAARSAIILKDKAMAKLREYESLVNGLEREGAENRNRLYNAEIEGAKLKYKNDSLREKLESIRPFEILAARAPSRRELPDLAKQQPKSVVRHEGGLSRQVVSKQSRRGHNTSLLQSSLSKLAGIDEQPSMLSSITGW